MQNFFFCFFCQPFSSFSLRLPRCSLLGIQRCLLLWPSGPDGHVAGPVALTWGPPLLLDLGAGPLQAGPDLLGLDLDLRALVTLRRLPRVRPEAADHDHARALRERLGDVLREGPPRRHIEERRFGVLPLPGRVVLDAPAD